MNTRNKHGNTRYRFLYWGSFYFKWFSRVRFPTRSLFSFNLPNPSSVFPLYNANMHIIPFRISYMLTKTPNCIPDSGRYIRNTLYLGLLYRTKENFFFNKRLWQWKPVITRCVSHYKYEKLSSAHTTRPTSVVARADWPQEPSLSGLDTADCSPGEPQTRPHSPHPTPPHPIALTRSMNFVPVPFAFRRRHPLLQGQFTVLVLSRARGVELVKGDRRYFISPTN